MIEIEPVYQKKLNKKKVTLVAIIAVSLILICASLIFAGKTRDLENTIAKQNQIKQDEQNEDIPILVNLEREKYIPIMTEEGMDNIEHIYYSPDEGKRVFLTFDDGPSSTVTELILDLLKAEDIKATFFVLGSMVEKNPEIVKRAYDEGHYIANHGYSHVYSKIYESVDTVIEEIESTDRAIAEAIGVEEYQSHLFRFPGGSVGGYYGTLKSEAKQTLKERNIAYLDWNALTRDSEGNFTKEQLLENLQNTVRNQRSLVILCHDATNKMSTYEALPDIIDYLRTEEYTFADMRDLIK